jgi:DNA-binding MarR family transcriptional regulator
MTIPVTDEILSIVFKFQEQGQDFSTQEVWVMLECSEQSRTVTELANKADVSYPAVKKYVDSLKAKRS